MKTGRNEPCSCGSGKKYKQCCLQADQQSFNPAREINEELRQLLDRPFDSPERVRFSENLDIKHDGKVIQPTGRVKNMGRLSPSFMMAD